MATLAYYEALLKDVIQPEIIRTENTKTVFSNRLKRSISEIKGDYFVAVTLVQGEQGINSTALRGGTYTTHRPAEFLELKALPKANHLVLSIYGADKVLSSGSNIEQAASMLLTKVNSAKDEWAVDMNRQYWNNGQSQIAYVTAAATSTTVPVSNVSGFRMGEYITIGTDTGRKVTDIKWATSEIVVGTSTTFAVNDTIYRDGALSGSTYYEMTGIPYMVGDSGTYHNLDRDTYSQLKSYCLDVGGPLTLEAIDQLIGVQTYTFGGEPSIIYTDEETVRWIKYLFKQQGYITDILTINLGYKAISYFTPRGAIPIVVDPACPKHTFWSLDERYIFLRQLAPFAFKSGNEGYWITNTTTDSWDARGDWYAELINTNPKASAKLHGYTTPLT